MGVGWDLMVGIFGPFAKVGASSPVESGIGRSVVVAFRVLVGLHRRRCSFTSRLA